MNESVELQTIENNNVSVENVDKDQLAAGNGGHMTHTGAELSENDPLLKIIQSGVDVAAVNNSSVGVQIPMDTEPTQDSKSVVKRVKEELKQTVVWKLRLWMVLILLLLAIVFMIIISISLNIALCKDPEDKYEASTYVVPRVFSGSLSVVNQNFSRSTTALHDLATQVQDEMNKLYGSSYALERYFNYTRVKTLSPQREGSVIVDFCLMFRMPLDSDLLLHYTLSQEMVSGVLRQHLYGQNSSSIGETLYIPPTSASLRDGGSNCTS